MRNLLVLALTPFLAACPALDVMEGKPRPYKAAQEARAAVLVAEPVVAAVSAPEPVEPEPAPEPECVPVWRVVTCP
jgi:hypothetical protein